MEVIVEVIRFERIWKEIRFRTLKKFTLNGRENILFSEVIAGMGRKKKEGKDSRY